MKKRTKQQCPCGSRESASQCCRPFLRGQATPSPEQLMRSRYTAYALGEVGYILATTHPLGPQFRLDSAAWESDVQRFCQRTQFERLHVRKVEHAPGSTQAWVTFSAHILQDNEALSMNERSEFQMIGSRWFYHSGESVAAMDGYNESSTTVDGAQ